MVSSAGAALPICSVTSSMRATTSTLLALAWLIIVLVYILIAVAFAYCADNSVIGDTTVTRERDRLKEFSAYTHDHGYGDIVPMHPLARSLCNVEAIIGQLYPATLLARLVTLEAWRAEPIALVLGKGSAYDESRGIDKRRTHRPAGRYCGDREGGGNFPRRRSQPGRGGRAKGGGRCDRRCRGYAGLRGPLLELPIVGRIAAGSLRNKLLIRRPLRWPLATSFPGRSRRF